MRFLVLLFSLLNSHHGQAFLRSSHKGRASSTAPAAVAPSLHTVVRSRSSSTLLFAVQQDEEKLTTVAQEAARLMKEAEMMRLQAEKMDMTLTLQKIEALETKLQNKVWLEKHPDQEAELKEQLMRLNDKLLKTQDVTPKKTEASTSSSSPATAKNTTVTTSLTESSTSEKKLSKEMRSRNLEPTAKARALPKIPLAGFDDADLKLYIPVAEDINKLMPNGTVEEKLEAFRLAPELQAHFQEKIQKMLMGPLEDMQELETLRKKYLGSTSSKEREQLKRKIDSMEEDLEQDGPFVYSEGFYCKDLAPLSDEELEERMEAVGALPNMLIAIYKQRNGLGEEDDLKLAIQMDCYEPQLQLLEQARMVNPFTDEMREEYVQGFNSLPQPVQDRFAENIGLEKGSDAIKVLDTMLAVTTSLSPMMQVVQASGSAEPPEYNDLDFVDRSRFLEEFFPALGNMESEHPSEDDVEEFASEILDRKTFMVTSKLERVAGGYYIRGKNLLEADEDGSMTAADKLVAQVSAKLKESSLADRLDFFYIIDPSPATDEELDFGGAEKPIFVVTSNNPEKLYGLAKPFTKAPITLSGFLSTFLFSVGACALNPSISDRIQASLDAASDTGVADIEWFSDLCFPIFFALLGIQLAHEVAHRVVAMRDKFDIGIPNVIPSITTGISGAITPLKSPPPNTKSLFDFAVAGPLAGLTVSLVLLISGLEMTASLGLGSQLPVVPVDLLRASSLGGGLVQFFLGNVAVMPNQGPAAVLELHPLAVAGFIGCMTNALALLPLGHTDGGRISVAMFGRRGAFVVKLFTTVLLCVAGIVGLDKVNILLVYVLFASIWQRELETPARNEVDELDFPRGLLGITTAIVVGLVLIPMF